jgi:hypothetical protein
MTQEAPIQNRRNLLEKHGWPRPKVVGLRSVPRNILDPMQKPAGRNPGPRGYRSIEHRPESGVCLSLTRATAWKQGLQYHFSAIVGHDTDGHWARCPELQGCYAQGDTYEAA